VLSWPWPQMDGRTALDIAHAAGCKKFICHAHAQRRLDEVWRRGRGGREMEEGREEEGGRKIGKRHSDFF